MKTILVDDMLLDLQLFELKCRDMGVIYTSWLRDQNIPQTPSIPDSVKLSRVFPNMGQEITLSGTGSSGYYYSFTTTEDAQILMLSVTTTATTADFVLYDESGNYCNTYDPQSAHSEGTAVLESAGKGNYYLLVTFGENGGTVQFTPTLKSNDAFGINNTADTAAPLPLDTDNTVLLLYRLDNYYSITTTKDAQDIQINLSGFGNLESANIEASFDGNGSFQYSRDTTLYYHEKMEMAAAGRRADAQPAGAAAVRTGRFAHRDERDRRTGGGDCRGAAP